MQKLKLSDGAGVIHRHADFPSRYAEPRHVDVWVPPNYEASELRYPVLYMHDGQNLFEPMWSYKGMDWEIDEAITQLIQAEGIPGAIVVGIWHSPKRWCDYMPQKFFGTPQGKARLEEFIQQVGGPPVSDHYLLFLVKELKPFIDATYRTFADPAHTLVMGSSMGGLISLYALEEYPEVFGGAGCLSTHWIAGGNALVDFLGGMLPPPGRHKLYFDYGTETQDAVYEPYQQHMDALMESAGYIRGKDWMTCKFVGAEHSERAWRARVAIPLKFLLRA